MKKRIESPDMFRQDRLPPRQVWADDLAVYDINPRFEVDLERYRLRVTGLVDDPLELTYAELEALSTVEVVADFHCVTRWSVRELVWEGVPARDLLDRARSQSDAKFVYVRSLDGYTTNMPLDALYREDCLFALKLGGKVIPREHGYPVRLVVPALYAWKSAKYVTEVELRSEDRPGYWEQGGYHAVGDPWLEQRGAGSSFSP
jgi:DMSO/TMAO reductase YedYZ molybdopterin-dependent catalytic subunit